ncbi:MAG: hypothetical protein FWG29_05675 [Treponema sp.]|nr:hypothetical protein [Treponema sp.]
MAAIVDKAAEAAKKAAEAAKKAAEAAKKDPFGAAATGVKTVVGGVTGVVQKGIGAAANLKWVKGTKAATSVDLSNALVGMLGAHTDIAIDSAAKLAEGIYKGKPVNDLSKLAWEAAKKSGKSSADDVVDKVMAVFKSYDPDFSKQDLSELPGAIKQGARDLFKK